MAPEIKEGKKYDGSKIDIFSTGVILFIIVLGIFPFREAKTDEYFYKMILDGRLNQYWEKTGGKNLSKEFKDLIIKMFSSHNQLIKDFSRNLEIKIQCIFNSWVWRNWHFSHHNFATMKTD